MFNSLSFLICDLDHSYGQFVLVPLCIWKPTIFDIHQYLDRSQLLYKMVSQNMLRTYEVKVVFSDKKILFYESFDVSEYL